MLGILLLVELRWVKDMSEYKIRIRKVRPRKIEGGYSYGSVERLKHIGKWEVAVHHGNYRYLYLGYFQNWSWALKAGHQVVKQHMFNPLAFS